MTGPEAGEKGVDADAVTKIAAEKQVPVVDLFARSIELLEKLGPTASDEFNPPPHKPDTTDHTHLNAKGAEVMAKLIADELHKVTPELAKLLK